MVYYVYIDGRHVDTIEEDDTYLASEYVEDCIANSDRDYFEDGAQIKLVSMSRESTTDVLIYNREGC